MLESIQSSITYPFTYEKILDAKLNRKSSLFTICPLWVDFSRSQQAAFGRSAPVASGSKRPRAVGCNARFGDRVRLIAAVRRIISPKSGMSGWKMETPIPARKELVKGAVYGCSHAVEPQR